MQCVSVLLCRFDQTNISRASSQNRKDLLVTHIRQGFGCNKESI